MLQRFRVEGLHGSSGVLDVQIHDDTLVLIGENGTGKSTLVNLIYFFITAQWSRLAEYRFTRLAAVIGDEEYSVTPEMIEQYSHAWRHSAHIPSAAYRTLMEYAGDSDWSELIERPELLYRTAADSGVPYSMLRRAVLELKSEDGKALDELRSIATAVRAAMPGPILYLPTYRRIEQDLKSIFRGSDLDAQLKKIRERAKVHRDRGFVELVEFGMRDVEETVNAKIASVKESMREGLKSLTGSYLRDVIRGEHSRAKPDTVLTLDLPTLDSILSRLDEDTLPSADKQRLRDRVVRVKERGSILPEDSVVVHFLSKLIQLQERQESTEHVVREFVATCNGYLAGKRLVYDELTYGLSVRRTMSDGSIDPKLDPLPLQSLSSGEKQIVSLFSHIYLSGDTGFYVIIDEPELSLSVPWQRRFLPDILDTTHCAGLIAVTHSPFIWENALESHVHAISEFVEY
jgi:energy-coupling factor transporter ATP-binding protein EcfA2